MEKINSLEQSPSFEDLKNFKNRIHKIKEAFHGSMADPKLHGEHEELLQNIFTEKIQPLIDRLTGA